MDGEDNAREAAGHMVLDILERCREKTEFILPIFKELLKRGIGLSNSGGELIRMRLGDELTSELANLIAQLTSGALSPKVEMYAPYRKIMPQQLEGKSVSELEALHEEAVISGKPTRSLKKALLLAYFRKKDLEKAHAIRQVLTQLQFNFFLLQYMWYNINELLNRNSPHMMSYSDKLLDEKAKICIALASFYENASESGEK